MKDHTQRIVHSSEDPNWRTPIACFEALNEEFLFTIDAAADRSSALRALWFGEDGLVTDALSAAWGRWALTADRHRFFLNPPFSRTLAARLKKVGDPAHASYRIENWAKKCWEESQNGATIVGLFPFAPQTDWYRRYVYGHIQGEIIDGHYPQTWSGHAAKEERRLPHRVSFLRADGSKAANAGVNTAIIVWTPATGMVGPWQPHSFYWSYR